jgi:hypothetical protein
MNASELTFGIEIECMLPAANAIAVGGYHSGTQIAGLPVGWNAQRDASIQARRGFIAVEVVSPILKGSDGIAQIKTVCQWLRTKGAKVNQSTGLHVHVGYATQDEAAVAKIVSVVANFEKAIYASTGTKSRERSRWCQSVQQSTCHRQSQFDRVTRYHVLNVKTNRPTVEFRAFAGTLNYIKIVAHVMTCLGLVEKTLKINKVPAWIAKTPIESSPIARGGEGLTALNRMFYWLGWTKGREQYTFGAIEGMPKVKTLKNQLVKLARKYDATA